METPILSKKQQKKSLSAKKGQKETIKNVLANPYRNYFPLVNNNDLECINKFIHDLPRLKPVKKSISWSVIKDVPKEERKKTRESYVEKIIIDEDIRQNLIFGINDVTSLLEKEKASSVLISADVNPQFMVKHVIDLSVLKKVPVLLIPQLRDSLKESTGIKSLTVAITNTTRHPLLSQINDKVETIHESYPVPESHMHYDQSKNGGGTEVSLNENMQHLDLRKEDLKVKGFDADEEKTVDAEDFYLYRKNCSSRVFVPEQSKMTGGICTKMETDESGFIGFGEIEADYKGLQVKRVRSNKERKKRFKSCK